MTESDALAEGFEQNRTRLRAVAYRMLGSLAEADDAVQEAWLRLSRSDAGAVDNLGAWLTTIVARVCLNVLRARNARREEFMGADVPDPVIGRADGANPEDEALLADSVGLALQVVLETLTPAERLAFVLHDLFDLPFDEIAPLVGRTPATARQLASRARRRVRGAEVQAPDPDLGRQRKVVDAFHAAATSTRSSRRLIPMSWRALTRVRLVRMLRWCCAARPPWPARPCGSTIPPRWCARPWSTGPREWS